MTFSLAKSMSRPLAAMVMGLGALAVVPVVGAVAFGGGCIDGTTPNCAGDAGCGPGIEAGDAGPDVVDAKHADDATEAGTADAGATDTGTGDAGTSDTGTTDTGTDVVASDAGTSG